MEQPLPIVINVVGLKDSGKTATAEGIISELASRGHRVGAVKTTRHPTLRVDPAATDTRRFADAGAAFVVGLLDAETHYFERRSSRATLREAAHLFPPGTRFLVCEGSVEPDVEPLYVVCLREAGDLERTLSTRGVPPGKVIAFSGIVGTAKPAGLPAPCFDARDPAGRAALADLLLAAARST
jgi:molybdopterin-guanine dinucleotide biosynthesis protein MobB